MSILVWAEHDGAALKEATLGAVSAAVQLGGALGVPVELLVAGQNVAAVAAQGARLAGVAQVWLADAAGLGDGLAHSLAEDVAPLVVGLMTGRSGFVAAATTAGKNIAPRVAALLDVAQISEVLSVEGPRRFTRPIYAGNAIATVESDDAQLVLTVRATSFPKAGLADAPAPITPVAVGMAGDNALSRFVSATAATGERPELTAAKVVVAGGRGLKDAQGFADLILPLADKLGGAVGASRAAVDAGFAGNDCQVGQTGKIVAPDIYIAIGISGAIQHLAGIKDAKTIIAINKDPEAPIMQMADYALVGDAFELVPELIARL